jgi:hypothetical protein
VVVAVHIDNIVDPRIAQPPCRIIGYWRPLISKLVVAFEIPAIGLVVLFGPNPVVSHCECAVLKCAPR